MTNQVGYGKRAGVVEELAERIRRGEFSKGQQLQGEHQLAEEFGVSRGTIRQALGELQRRRLISTQSGIGSFVTFDGHPLDPRSGWAQALADVGAELSTDLLDITPIRGIDIPVLPDDLELHDAIAIRRTRSAIQTSGEAQILSFECSTVPATGSLADLASTGLIEGSLSKTLQSAGLVAASGQQRVDVHMIDERQAGILQRQPGSAFLRSVRTSFTSEGRFAEHVISLLDPAHFTLHLEFGENP